MSALALVISGAVLIPLVIGVITGAIMHPQGPWKETLNVAAVGAAIVVGLLLVVIVAAMVTHPTECTRAGCQDTDTQAAIQIVFLAPALAPIYAFVLLGAAVGRLLGRGIACLSRHAQGADA